MVWVCIKEDNFQKTQNKLFSLRLCASASPMRTFVNMQNRFGDFRFNPGCLM